MLYHVYGIHIESERPLAEFLACHGGRRPDAWFRLLPAVREQSAVPPTLAFSMRTRTSLDVDLLVFRSEAEDLLRWDGMCDFRISAANSDISCTPVEGVPERFWKGILFGPAFAYFLHLRGLPTLHASAACLPSGAVAFLADPGGGKSTLASAFARNGHPLLTDDLLALRPAGSGYSALPGFPWVNMAPGSIEYVQYGAAQNGHGPVYRHNAADEKSRVPVDGHWGTFQRAETPLNGLFLLDRGGAQTVQATRLGPGQAIGELMEHVNGLPVLSRSLKKQSLSFLAAVTAKVPVYRLSYPSRFDVLPEVIAAVNDTTNAKNAAAA